MFAAEEMDKNDMELRKTIRTLWPIHAKKMENLLVPPNEGSHLMVPGSSTVMWATGGHLFITLHCGLCLLSTVVFQFLLVTRKVYYL